MAISVVLSNSAAVLLSVAFVNMLKGLRVSDTWAVGDGMGGRMQWMPRKSYGCGTGQTRDV